MQDRTRTKVWMAAAVVLWSTGCGARTDLDEGSWELDTLDDPQLEAPGDEPIEDPIDEPIGEPGDEPGDEPKALAPVAECDLEPIWWQPEPIHRLTPSVFSVSPAEHMLMLGGESNGHGPGVVRMEDGDMMTSDYTSRTIEGLDASWGRALERDWVDSAHHVYVVNADRTDTLFDRAVGSTPLLAVLSEDGNRVGMAECLHNDTSLGVELTIWSVGDAREPIAKATLPDEQCARNSPNTTHFTITPDGSRVAYVTNSEAFVEDPPAVRVVTLDAMTNVSGSVELPMGETERELDGYYGVVASLEYTPAGLLSVVSAFGQRTVYDDALEVVSQETRGAFISNPDTFMPPLPMSPTAWTTDGDVEASVATDGAVELRLADGTVVTRLFAPEASDLAEWGGMMQGVENAPVAVTFSPDDDMIAVAFRKGIGLWGCPDALPAPRAISREVQLDAPATATVGEEVRLEMATTGATSDWTIYKLFVDGALHQTWFDPSQITYRPYHAGQHVLEFEVDDGWTPTRSEAVVMDVRER